MDITIDQQVALDEAFSPSCKPTQDWKTDVSEIYMQEFWVTATVHHHSIRFKMNNKKRIVNLEYFREMLQISPRIPNQQFDELPFEEEILAFLRELGHSGERKVEHKDAKKSNEMYYPRFTKVIVNFFMTKDQSIPKRNKINWHYARDDHMFTTIKLVSRHQNTQQYGVILPVELTNEAIKNSESYKEYYAIALGAEPPKTKASVKKKQSSSDTTVPPPTKGKRLKISAKVDKPAKEKQPAKSSTAKGLTVLSERTLRGRSLYFVLEMRNNVTPPDTYSVQAPFGVVAGLLETGKGGDEVSESKGESDEEETRQEEDGSFDPIPITPKGSEEENNDEEDQELRLNEQQNLYKALVEAYDADKAILDTYE
nr:hypothetical protein [Tanacetum cinerariifolium]